MRVEKTSPLPPHGIQRTHCQHPTARRHKTPRGPCSSPCSDIQTCLIRMTQRPEMTVLHFDFFRDSQFFALFFFSDPLYCSYHLSLVWFTSTAGDREKPLCAFMSAAEFISRQQQGTGTTGVFLPSLPDAPPTNNLNKK